MSKVLIFGDFINDEYHMCKATRICPEAPVPILVPEKPMYSTPGGAGLVEEQLRELIGDENVILIYGSYSRKTRYFAGNQLVMRLDEDSIPPNFSVDHFESYRKAMIEYKPDAIIISDYGKGAINSDTANFIMNAAECPIFVDSKYNWRWYSGVFAMFPNEHENLEQYHKGYVHEIRKLGARGCSVNGQLVSIKNKHIVRDVTGAGDCFLAGFVAQWLKTPTDLIACAEFANRVAAVSVTHIGTHVSTIKEITESLDEIPYV